jgi:hypothetical protein
MSEHIHARNGFVEMVDVAIARFVEAREKDR